MPLQYKPLLSATDQLSGSNLSHTPPEINLIPFIDVLLVIIIFLMISTTFTQYQELSITLPQASGKSANTPSNDIRVAISKDGRYAINGQVIDSKNLAAKIALLSSKWNPDYPNTSPEGTGQLVISADAKATHQSVMFVLEVVSSLNINRVVYATQDNKNNPSKQRLRNP